MKKKILTLVILIVVIGVGWWLVRRYFTIDEIAAQEAGLRGALADRPVTSFLVGLLIFVGLSLIPPTAGKSLVFGWLFGLWQGIVLANVGLTLAALVMFSFSRYVLREGLRSRFGAYVRYADRVMETDGAHYLFALRMMHAPYTFLNYAMGATKIEIRSFWWATQLGLLPGNILFIYAGTQLPTLEQAAAEGLTSIASPTLIVAFVLIGVFPIVARWVLRRWRAA